MISPIVKRSFGNTFHHNNGPNQLKHIHKNNSQQYQPRPYQIPRISSILYLKEDCLGCGLNKKGVIICLIQNDRKLETFPLRGQFFIKKKSPIEHLIHKNKKSTMTKKFQQKN